MSTPDAESDSDSPENGAYTVEVDGEEVDFLLEIDEEALYQQTHHQVVQIHNTYDAPLAPIPETLQNAVDAIRTAIRDHGLDRGKITIEIDRDDQVIRIHDNGSGLTPYQEGPELLKPYRTNKASDNDLIGEKGVGLIYVAFACESFTIDTQSQEGYFHAEIEGGATWREQDSGTAGRPPKLSNVTVRENPADLDDTGTTVTIEGLSQPGDVDVFELSLEELVFYLRTMTAVGSTRELFGQDDIDVDVELRVIDTDGTTHTRDVDWGYGMPELVWDTTPTDLNEFDLEELVRQPSLAETKLAGQPWFIRGEYDGTGDRVVHYAAFFAPTARDYHLDDDVFDIVPRITVSANGMPTGIARSTPSGTGEAGYFGNFHIVMEYNKMDFDLGRTSVAPARSKMFHDVAAEAFREFTKLKQYIREKPGSAPPVDPDERDFFRRKLEQQRDNGFSAIQFRKAPQNEAETVIAFAELVGAGKLDAYQGLASGYKQTYDWYGRHEIATSEVGEEWLTGDEGATVVKSLTVVEFKSQAEKILIDLEDRRKYLGDIDVLVCWDFDRDKLADGGITVEPLTESEQLYQATQYQFVHETGSTSVLSLSDLETTLERQEREDDAAANE